MADKAIVSAVPASAHDVAEAHRRLLADPSLQFKFEPVPQPGPPPSWLIEFGRFLKAIAPVLKYVFWGVLALVAVMIVVFLVREILRIRWPERFGKKPSVETAAAAEWRPAEATARALLEDADRLAAEGRFAEAVHLILYRSIADIEGRRPKLVRPALTSRDIAAHEGLPQAARTAFASIARVVESSWFGGAPVDADVFAECRRTYEAFAFPETWS